MAYMSFTRKYDDKSSEQGFEFVFYCDISGEPVKTKFIGSQTGNKAGKARLIGKGISMGGGILKDFSPAGMIAGFSKSVRKEVGESGDLAEKGGDFAEEFAKKFGTMSPQWHKEHETAFEIAQNEAKQNFNQCPVCNRWACIHCWNRQKEICIEDAKNTVICSHCHQPAGAGKFCNNCGASLILKCPKCGAQYPEGKKFCGECGASLG